MELREVPLSDSYRAWLAENLLRGQPAATLIAALETRGISAEVAQNEVNALVASPIFAGAKQVAVRARQLELLVKLHNRTGRTSPFSSALAIERRSHLQAGEFFAQYYATGTPVVLTDWTADWPALHRWTLDYLEAQVGEVDISMVDARDSDPDYDVRHVAHQRTIKMADYLARVRNAGSTNDFYFTANDRNIDRPELAKLYDDVDIDPTFLDVSRLKGSAALWIGPGGTVTPLHHDTSNIMFCQLAGKKRFLLARYDDLPLLEASRGVYSRFDPEAPDFTQQPTLADVLFSEVVLDAGDTLFLPVGMWHHVRALTMSIGLAFTNFVRSNQFDWFRPGALRP